MTEVGTGQEEARDTAFLGRAVAVVDEARTMHGHVAPHRRALGGGGGLSLLRLRVEEEGTEATRVHILEQEVKQMFVVLERARKLALQLVDTVEELEKDRTALLVRRIVVTGSVALCELVPEGHPLAFYQDLQALQRAVVRIQQGERQRGELRCAVPPVRAMHQHRAALLHQAGHQRGATQNGAQVLQPVATVQLTQKGAALTLAQA
mmetsp:Transcript_49396/g.124186  ORF Transcript_49396/g.124186 Transcript_49396/m.124186 type:complete len:207 (+) Transcript_49396:1230-1850(+)